MDQQSVEATLAALEAHEYGWRAEIPADHGTFLGRPISLDIETTDQPKARPPKPNAGELALARTILAALPAVLADAEREFTAYITTDDDPDAVAQIGDPHAWISREEIDQEGPGHWAFVVGRLDNDDFGYHLEFDGADFQACWSGD